MDILTDKVLYVLLVLQFSVIIWLCLSGAILDAGESQVVFLPLMTHDAKLLPVHFLTQAEVRDLTHWFITVSTPPTHSI